MEKQYKPNEFAKLLNVSVKTLQRWDNDGVLKAFRSPKDRRYYKHSQYIDYVGESSKAEEIERKVIDYSYVTEKSKLVFSFHLKKTDCHMNGLTTE